MSHQPSAHKPSAIRHLLLAVGFWIGGGLYRVHLPLILRSY